MDNANNTDAETAAALDDLYGGPRKTAAEILDIVRVGGIAVVASHTKPLLIDSKTLAKFERAGEWLLKDDNDGRGYRVRQGRGSVYVFRQHLKTREAK